jgi:membrane protease YdiL (CAAX protease family)
VPVGTALAFGEEFGWRGYLLPRLLPLGEVKAAIIVGLIWGPWHLPVLIVGLNYPGEPIIADLVSFACRRRCSPFSTPVSMWHPATASSPSHCYTDH